jgi:hypothetical protein
MSENPQPKPHDCYGNPFLVAFKEAVEFKIAHCFELDTATLFEQIISGKYAEFLGEAEVEIFLYPTPKKIPEGIEIFQVLTEIIAILAFCPHGVTMFGYHYAAAGGQFTAEKVFEDC